MARSSTVLLSSLLASAVFANDPAPSWLTYAVYTAPKNGMVTMVNTTWIVPSLPAKKFGSNAPGWWYGVQTSEGDGALIQPILAYGYKGSHYSIFNAWCASVPTHARTSPCEATQT